ncbi:MAG: uracil-DNA glycosylase [Phycisphaerales bacterium]
MPEVPRTNPDMLARVVRQHAMTSRLLGVDFVPAFRVAGGAGEALAPDADAPAMPPQPLPSSYLESKPQSGPPQPATPAARAAGPAPAKAGADPAALLEASASAMEPVLGGGLAGYERAARKKGEDDRDYKARLLGDLRARYEKDAPHTQFVTAHTNIVFGDGDSAARLVFVGEAPGAEEDRQGIPFVGRSGELLNKMIVAMGLSRQTVYICNVLKTRPPDNATPTAREAGICEPYLQEQLSIISPDVIVTLGLPAVRTLLKTEDTMTRLRGRWASLTLVGGKKVPVMPTYHPAYLLRAYTPENRQKVWSDLQMVMQKLGGG